MGWMLKSVALTIATWIGEDMELSKWSLLGRVMRTYHPLGLIAPVTIRFRMLFQQIRKHHDTD
jgi:Pao retrotransposon peptidase